MANMEKAVPGGTPPDKGVEASIPPSEFADSDVEADAKKVDEASVALSVQKVLDSLCIKGSGDEKQDPLTHALEAIDEKTKYRLDLKWRQKVAAICRQVDHYFSDDNLIDDRFLLRKMQGASNRPIPLDVIHGFKKMRQFQPVTAVIEALKEGSAIVNIVYENNVCCVQRKKPLAIPLSSAASGPDTNSGPKRKKKKAKPTGFEDYYADAPLTPQEYQDEEDLYDSDLPFLERLQTALERYSKKRRFVSQNRAIFEKWMRLGGIDAGQKMFQGGYSKEDLEELSANEIASISNTNYVGADKYTGEGTWVVDFEGVAKHFLGAVVVETYQITSDEDAQSIVQMLRNFYNYLLYHSVCPEHEQDVQAAKRICDMADKELHKTVQLQQELPGKFNIACSVIFGGDGSRRNTEATWELEHGDLEQAGIKGAPGLLDAWCKLCKQKDEEHIAEPDEVGWPGEIDTEVGLEVVEIKRASGGCRHLSPAQGSEAAVGEMFCRLWKVPTFVEQDGPAAQASEGKGTTLKFYLDDELLGLCFVGMKMEARLGRTTNGRAYLANVTAVRCSFFTLLPNELVNGRIREVKWYTREELLARQQAAHGEDGEDGEGGEGGEE